MEKVYGRPIWCPVPSIGVTPVNDLWREGGEEERGEEERGRRRGNGGRRERRKERKEGMEGGERGRRRGPSVVVYQLLCSKKK